MITGRKHEYGFIGVEEVNELDLGLVAMDWRHYDPAIGRFVGIDALSESYNDHTPYHYSKNSPLMYSDPTGLFTDVVNEDDPSQVIHIEDGYDFEWVVDAATFNTIQEAGDIPDNLKWDRTKAFWKQVWQEVTTSDGSASDEVTQFMITDEIEDGIETIDRLSNGQYAGAALTLFLRKVQKGKKGYNLIKKLFKSGKKGKMPTPDLNPDQFKRVGDTRVHKKTGAIYKKSHTSHGNVGNTGDQWKAYPKGTTDFGKTSKTTGTRVTIDGDGKVIGN
ncbi:RHS repeat-associated core domain-containing protein [Aquimarina sp. W85]|uniref:RHS repeat-associated core domain-containing protein n=1 Tax=Aquimarina rhodophyticola TaxID=3342246 RepID=UPI00366E0182